jgi:transposase
LKRYPYIAIERRETEKDYMNEFESVKETFERIETSEHKDRIDAKTTESDTNSKCAVYVKKVSFEEGCRLLCYSEGREQKELAIHTLKEKRFLEDFTRLQNSIAKGTIRMKEKIAHRVGRINERHASASHKYDIIMELDSTGNKVVTLKAVKKPDDAKKVSLFGCYVIETSHKDMSAKEVWKYYMRLANVEKAFRSMKSDLGIRPVLHQTAERTKAHLFISVLAYHLLISIEFELRKQGDSRSWATIREQLSTHQRNTVILTDAGNNIHHVRVSGMPEPEHQEIYRLLKVKDPLGRRHRLAASRK